MFDEYSLSVIIPVYNEILLLEKSVSEISAFLKKYFKDYEIIIIESGSTDGSREACDKLANKHDRIRVIHEPARNGFGSALKLGYRNAIKDLVWLITVDLPFPLEPILMTMPLFSKYDCVLSYRSHDTRNIFKKIRSIIYNNIAKALLGLPVKHVKSAFKVFKRDVIQNMSLLSNGWALDAEILYQIKKQHIPYIEIPVETHERKDGKSSITSLTPVYILKEIIYIMRKKKTSGSYRQ